MRIFGFAMALLLVEIAGAIALAASGGAPWPAIALGVALGVLTLAYLQRRSAIENARRHVGVVHHGALSRVPAGEMASIRGSIEAGPEGTLTAPASGAAVVAYRILLQHSGRSGEQQEWVTIRTQERRRPFYVRDDHGERALVEPGESPMNLGHASASQALTPEVQALLAEEGVDDGAMMRGQYRWRESALLPGTVATVVGRLQRDPVRLVPEADLPVLDVQGDSTGATMNRGLAQVAVWAAGLAFVFALVVLVSWLAYRNGGAVVGR